MTARIDMAEVGPEQLERSLDVIFAETQQDQPRPPRGRRWLRPGRQRHRATRFSQILATELIAAAR